MPPKSHIHERTVKQASEQASKQAKKQRTNETNKHNKQTQTNKQTHNHTNTQTSKQTNKQLGSEVDVDDFWWPTARVALPESGGTACLTLIRIPFRDHPLKLERYRED